MWTTDEINVLLTAYKRYGSKWSRIRDVYPEIYKHYKDNGYKKKIEELQLQAEVNVKCKCNNIITEKHLFTNGLYCTNCNITFLELSKLVKQNVTYIIFSFNQVLYVGQTKTLYDKLINHTKDHIKLNPLLHKIKITFLHSEYIIIKLFNPIKNILSGNTNMVIKNKNNKYIKTTYNKLQHKLYYNINNSILSSDDILCKKKYIIKEDNIIFTCGIIFANIYVNDTFCFKKDTTTCNCNMLCSIRSRVNILKGLNKWYPIPINMVKENVLENTDKFIDYSVGKDLNIKSKEFLISVVKRKNILDSTKKSYEANITLLCNNGFLNILNNITYETLYNFINDTIFIQYSNSTSYLILTVMIILFNQTTIKEKFVLFGFNWFSIYKKLVDYYKYYKEISQKESNVKNLTEELNWINYPELLDIIKKEKNIIHEKYNNNTISLMQMQSYILLMLHLEQAAVRNDYYTILLFDYDKDKDNYLTCEDGKYTFVFNTYKTSKYLGKIEMQIKEPVLEDLLLLVNYRKSIICKYLITNVKNEPIDSSRYSKLLMDYTEKLTGKRIGSSMIRKIYVSWMRRGEMECEESEKMAREMMHSEDIQRSLYRKV